MPIYSLQLLVWLKQVSNESDRDKQRVMEVTDHMVVKLINGENVEGIGNPEDEILNDYPLDTFLIRTENRTVFEVVRRIQRNAFIMDPEFQREFVWNAEKQSKLIESVLMRIPLPVFYIAERDDGKVVVVDGLQRLTTFLNFVNDEFRLRLPGKPELDGKNFSELEGRLQNRIEDCNLTLYLIDSKAPERARLDIFERVNSGEPLSRQQMRNCLYLGNSTRFLKTEAERPLFLKVTSGSLNRTTMRDREFINRFCGFRVLDFKGYRGDMDLFLSQTLVKMNKMSTSELTELSSQLHNGLANNFELFGTYSFRKHTRRHRRQKLRHNPINASLWDVMCSGLALYNLNDIIPKKSGLLSEFYQLLEDEEFLSSITLSTNQTSKVTRRFEIANSMIKGVLDD